MADAKVILIDANAGNQSAASYEEQAKRAKELMTIQETLQSIFLANADSVETLANGLAKVARFLADNATAIGYVTLAYIGLNALMAINAFLRARKVAKALLDIASGERWLKPKRKCGSRRSK